MPVQMAAKSILIVEDDFSFALELEMALSRDDQFQVHIIASADEALTSIDSSEYDAVLLDLYLNGSLSGIELGNAIKERNIPVIVITSYADEALYKLCRSFSPFAFLVKPFDRLTLISSLDRAIYQEQPKAYSAAEKEELLVRANSQLHKVRFDDITYINSDGNYCVIHTDKLRYAIKKSLKRLLEELPSDRFIRIHKSYVVQTDLINNVDLANKTLSIGQFTIPFGKRFKKELMEQFH